MFTCALRRPVPQEPQPPLHPRRRRRRRRRRSTRRHRRHFLPRALIPLVPFPFPVPVPAPVPLAALVFLARRPGPPQARQQPPQVLVRRAGQRELALQPRPLRLSCVCVFVCVCVCVCVINSSPAHSACALSPLFSLPLGSLVSLSLLPPPSHPRRSPLSLPNPSVQPSAPVHQPKGFVQTGRISPAPRPAPGPPFYGLAALAAPPNPLSHAPSIWNGNILCTRTEAIHPAAFPAPRPPSPSPFSAIDPKTSSAKG